MFDRKMLSTRWLSGASLAVLLAGSAYGQWSTDPANHLLVGNAAGDQNQPKIVLRADGGFSISYLSTQGTGWDTFVQRLNAGGVEQWAHDGVNCADTNFSSTEDYGLAVDGDGNTLIAFRDDHGTFTQIGLQKIAPDGSLPWGPFGVTVSAATSAGEVHSPGVVVTSDGNYVVGYSRGTTTTNGRAWYHKITPTGTAMWGSGVSIAPASNSYTAGTMVAGDGGAVIAVLQTSGSFTANRRVHVQQLDSATGAQVWNGGVPIVVQTANQLQIGNFASAVSDGAGGAVIAWYEVPNGAFMCRAQRVDSSGTLLFPAGGAAVASTAGPLRVSPDVMFDAGSGSTYVFYGESDALQANFAVYGQKFDATGARQWGEGGAPITSLSSSQTSFVRTTKTSGGAMVAWFEAVGPMAANVRAAMVDETGAVVGSVVTVDTNFASKTRLSAAATADGSMALVYGEASAGDLDIRSLRMNPDGSLGVSVPTCVADVDDGTGTGTPDGGVTIDDLLYYLSIFNLGQVSADVDDGTGTGTPDGGVTIDDLLYYLARFNAGC